MSRAITERFVRRSIIDFLARKGFSRGLREKETAEHGVDIRVRHNDYARYFLVETKGESPSKSKRSIHDSGFVNSLGQVITRMRTGNARYYYAIGLPELSARIALRRLPWQVAKKLLLYIFSVNASGKVKQYSWKDLKSLQK